MTRTAQLRLDLANNNSPITCEISRQVDSDRHKHEKSSTQTPDGSQGKTPTSQHSREKRSVTTDGSQGKTPTSQHSREKRSVTTDGSQGKTPTSQHSREKRSVTADGRSHQKRSTIQQRSKAVATSSRLPRPDQVSSVLSSSSDSYSVSKHKPLQLPAEHSVNKEVNIKTSDQQTTKSDVATSSGARSSVPKSQSIAMRAAYNAVPDHEYLKMDQSDIKR